MIQFQNLSIKNKIITLIIVIVIISTLVSSSIYLVNDLTNRKDALIEMAEMETELIGSNCSAGLEFNQEPDVQRTLQTLKVLEHIYSAYVYDANNEFFTDYFRTTPTEEDLQKIPKVLTVRDTIYFDDSYNFLYVIKPINDRQRSFGTILLKISTERIFAEIKNSIFSFIVLLLSIILIAYLIAINVQKYISSPIISLADSISEMTETGNYSRRVHRKSSDEVGQLYSVFNEMLENLEQRRKERQVAEAALKESEERLDLAIKGSNDGLWDWPDITQKEMWWSERTFELLGVEKSEFESSFDKIMTVLHPDDLDSFQLDLRNHFELKIAFDVEYRFKYSLKRYKWYRLKGQAVWNEQGTAIRMSGSVQDIDLRKTAELQLSLSQRRYKNLFESAGIALIEHDFSKLLDELEVIRSKKITDYYEYLQANPKIVTKLRNTISVINANHSAVVLLEAEDKESIIADKPAFHYYESVEYIIRMFSKLLRNEKYIEVESVISTTKGKKLNVIVTLLNPLTQKDYSSTLLSYVDITDLKEFAKEREKLLDEITAKNTELEQIIYVTSHDLRSPLVNIQGFSKEINLSVKEIEEMLNEKGIELDEEIKSVIVEDIPASLNFIINSTQKMDLLLNGLLRLSRLGRAALNPKTLDVNEIIDIVLKSHQFQINEKGIEIVIDPLDKCYGDEVQITQVFSNLIDNAIKYSDRKRKNTIQIRSKINNSSAIYAIEDTGIGILKEHQKKVFEIFHRLNPSHEISGEGIGLSIVKRILMRHEGKIWVESEINKGSTFYIQLPIKKPT